MIRRRFGCAFGPQRRAVAAAAVLAFAGMTLAVAQQQASPPAQPPLAAAAQTPAPAQPAAVAAVPAAAAAGLDAVKAALDDIEKSLTSGAQTEDGLADLKRRLAPLRGELRDRQTQRGPRLKEIDQRLSQLGPPPDSAGTEDPVIASERQRLAAQRVDVEGALKQSTLLAGRAGDLEQRINDRRRELFTNRLFARGTSLFDSQFWSDLAEAVPAELGAISALVSLWAVHARSNGGAGGALAAIVTLAALGGAAWFAARWRRRLTADPTPRRYDKALAALLILGASTVTVPVLILAAFLVLRNFGLMPDPVVDIGFGLAAAAAVMGFGRGVAVALFAPGEPARRIFPFSDQEAESYASHLTWTARAFGAAVFLNVVHRAVGAPVAPTIATGELLAVVVLAITVHLLWRSAQADFRPAHDGTAGRRLAWFRGVFWLIAAAIATSLATGYVGLAVFLAGRLLATLAIGGAVAILVAFIDALFTELVAADTPYGRKIAAISGLSPRGLDLVETLISAVLRLVLIVLAVLLVVGFSGIFAEDVFSLFQRATWDYVIGGITLSPGAILSAIAFLAVGGLAIRAAQRWLQTKFLPRTGLDAGLQNSILALFGYGGLFVVLALSLAALGIDLQKIALIAGALSVGIGFGLQSIVANFVSGLILLAERPIRVGDWVVVKNEEGWVRRISVRATEIETFDRARVIIPNQDLITGVVKNWTHGNTMGRIVIKVRVAYDSDIAKVRDILRAVGTDHPQVLRTPPPAVYLMGFGDIGLDFELRCLLGNVEQAFAVRTDLQTEILHRFREAGVKIPFPAHDARVPGPSPPTAPAAPAPAEPKPA